MKQRLPVLTRPRGRNLREGASDSSSTAPHSRRTASSTGALNCCGSTLFTGSTAAVGCGSAVAGACVAQTEVGLKIVLCSDGTYLKIPHQQADADQHSMRA